MDTRNIAPATIDNAADATTPEPTTRAQRLGHTAIVWGCGVLAFVVTLAALVATAHALGLLDWWTYRGSLCVLIGHGQHNVELVMGNRWAVLSDRI